ncbi:MAG TPA: hypothetical protein VKZ97_02630 [Flavobacteriaceae bacterium]|nr:hypothetical protein [Flavobacteriaceae bacterium]
MKHVFKNTLALVALFATMLSFANEIPHIDMGGRDKVTFVTFNNVKKGAMLSLKDYTGQVMYKEQIDANGDFTKRFDFTLLPIGLYSFEMEMDIEIKTKPFEVTEQAITFYPEKEVKFHKPVVKLKDNLVLISQLSLEKQPLRVKLYYEADYGQELIYSENLSGELILKRVLKLNEAFTGAYKLVLSSQDHTFVETFRI